METLFQENLSRPMEKIVNWENFVQVKKNDSLIFFNNILYIYYI